MNPLMFRITRISRLFARAGDSTLSLVDSFIEERQCMPIDWKPFVDFIHRHQRFLLTTHIRPDGDGIGSILALGEVLQQMGKEIHLIIASSFPSRYRFLDPDQHIERFAKPGDPWRSTEAVIVMD